MLVITQAIENEARDKVEPMKALVLGSIFMGVIFDAMLAGVITCQLTHWVPYAKHDARHTRMLVIFAALVACAGSVYTWSTWMKAFVYNYGTYARFISVDSIGWYGLLDVCVVVPVQLVFTERAVRINNNSAAVAIICGTLIALTGALGATFSLTTRGDSVMTQKLVTTIVSIAWPGVCTSAHIIITSCILYGLLNSKTGSPRSDKLINRLISVSIESQLPSTMVGMAIMITVAADHQSPFIPFIAIVHPKVFLVGMLAMINLRHEWRLTGKTPSQYQSTELKRSSVPQLSSQAATSETCTPIGTPKYSHASFDSPTANSHSHSHSDSNSHSHSHGIDKECGMHKVYDLESQSRKSDAEVVGPYR